MSSKEPQLEKKDTPLVVSPFDAPSTPQITPSSKLGYLWMALWGIVFLGIILLLRSVIGLLPATVIVLTFYLLISSFVTLRIYLLGKKLQFTVRSQDDLALIRPAVSLNMKAAYLMMITIWPLFIVALLLGEMRSFFLLMVVNFIIWPFAVMVEKRFKNMKVESDDPEVAAGYEAILAIWKEPRFGIPQ